MRAYKLEKRADGIIRWLERMKLSYKSGAVESAYMDAECARADLEDLRSDVFAGIRHERKSRVSGIISRSIVLAMVIVMASVMPISRDKVPVQDTLSQPAVLAETPPAMTEDVKPKKIRKAVPQKRPQPSVQKTKPQSSPKIQAAPVKSVAYDKIFSLVQTGQRALKDNNSVVKIK